MPDNNKPKLVARHKKVAFYGVVTDSTETFHRMKNFTQLSESKNPIEHNRTYVDEPFEESDVLGFSPSISFAFDRHTNNPVHTDIIKIADEEIICDDAVRNIVVVEVETGKAIMRPYAVIPDSEGDDVNVYTHSGNFKCKGEKIFGTATSTDDWKTCTFTADED